MELPEYYLTDCETEILQNHTDKILKIIGKQRVNLIELGAGNGEKTRILINGLVKNKVDFTFIPIDISPSAIKTLIKTIKKQIPGVKIKGLVSEYFKGLRWLSNLNKSVNIILFLGSNIGNFEPSEADVFLSSLWNACNHGDYVLVGFDLRKDIKLLLKAYNDSKGITAQFNLNLLRRINRELGGNFNLKAFKYYSTYNAHLGAIKSYLISQKKQTVVIEELNRMFYFRPWEPIHTESSYKFLIDDIENLARRGGFEVRKNFLDSRRYFVDSLWQVKKD
jgi:dimethylhistidine N-methyltransferase